MTRSAVDPLDLRDLALEAARAAAALVRERRRDGVRVADTKSSDVDVVTQTDRDSEALIRRMVLDRRSEDAFLGEETGTASGSSGVRWVVDPIDGTSGYARGIPVWATLLALEREGGLEVGVISAPALHARWWGTLEDGAFRDGSRVRVSGVAALADAHLACEGPPRFELAGRGSQIVALERRCWRTRGFGDFWPYAMVADGSIDIAVEPQGLEAGIAEEDLEPAARRGVAGDGGSDVFPQSLEHGLTACAISPGRSRRRAWQTCPRHCRTSQIQWFEGYRYLSPAIKFAGRCRA